MIYRDGWYYLLATHGSCCAGADSGYNIRVGRARKVTGPFLDPDGIALRIVHTPTPTESFLGVTFGPDGQQAFYAEPKLEVSTRPHRAVIAGSH